MKTLFKNWWVILIQGILMITLSIVIFNNPDVVLATLALWLGIAVIATGVVGLIAYFSAPTAEQDLFSLIGSIAIIIVGLLMVTKIIATIKLITIAFGLLTTIIGLALLFGGFSGRKNWSLWWVISLLGAGALITGVKSIMDIYSGSESISNLLGIAVLISGIGLICLAILKKKIVLAVKNAIQKKR